MSLDFSQDGYEELFRNALQQGINLFCGAGFSVEASDAAGVKLPVGAGLLQELKREFPEISEYGNLPRASTKLMKTDKQGFYTFLENRFAVKDFDPAYFSLLEIRIKNIYTTNIDDLFFKILDGSDTGIYLNDCSIKGATYNDTNAVQYFPLHGCIRNKGKYVFGATEIASAFSQRGTENSWKSLANDASKHPILFWGWNFEDTGPIEAMYSDESSVDENINRWVLLRNPKEETLDYIKALGFNVIIGDTMEMLAYLSDFANEKSDESIVDGEEYHNTEILEQYCIPCNDSHLPSYPLKQFFLEYAPRWSHIYSHDVPKTMHYRKIANSIVSSKNTIVAGMRGTGKTTLMMQLLADFDTPLKKHFLIAPSVEQVNTYIKNLNGQRSLLFVDDCFRDTDAVIELFKASNIRTVCFDRDFNYERQFHRIKKEKFRYVDVTEITKADAQSILNIIPTELRRQNAGTKNSETDLTILSFLAKNLRSVDFRFMDRFSECDPIAAKVFLLIAYVHSCGTPCSFDMIYSFLGDENYTWQQMLDIVDRVGGLIKEISDELSGEVFTYGIQDYYQCRSRLLAEKILSSVPKGNSDFTAMLIEFAQFVPTFKICQYDKFKRSAYDAEFAFKAFEDIDDGKNYYEICAEKDGSEYIYQQAAIYFKKMKDYKSAFGWIEKARNLAHYNRFSIDSTYAQIYFEVNIHVNKEQAEAALEILGNCCQNDKRKSIHFANYAKCCLEYFREYDSTEYLSKALEYIDEGVADDNLSLSLQNKHELLKLKEELTQCLASDILAPV